MINQLIKYISFTTSTIIVKSAKDFGEVENEMIVLKNRTKYLKSGLIPFIFKDELSLRKFKIMNCSMNNVTSDYRPLFALEKDVKFMNNLKFFMK